LQNVNAVIPCLITILGLRKTSAWIIGSEIFYERNNFSQYKYIFQKLHDWTRTVHMKLILDVCFPHFHFSLLKFNLAWSFWENYFCILLKGPQVDVYLFYYWYLMQDDHQHMSKCYNRSYGRNSVFSITRILFVTKQLVYKGNNKITELRTIFQRESQNP
jgi:hypothetical protein